MTASMERKIMDQLIAQIAHLSETLNKLDKHVQSLQERLEDIEQIEQDKKNKEFERWKLIMGAIAVLGTTFVVFIGSQIFEGAKILLNASNLK
jgi:uncharacterized protein YlxW (UPF0749 family)